VITRCVRETYTSNIFCALHAHQIKITEKTGFLWKKNVEMISQLRAFVASWKAAIAHERVHVVLGNESADLDSIISAITMSFYLHLTQPRDVNYVGLINITRPELACRLGKTRDICEFLVF
jgi:hypothetical protein